MLTTEQIRTLIREDRVAEFYNSRGWRNLADEVIGANHGECQMCKDSHILTRATLVHHVKPLREHPELACDRSNLMPLCHDCHERIHNRGIYANLGKFTNVEKW